MDKKMEWGGQRSVVVNDQIYSPRKENILTALFLSSLSPCHAPLCAHRHPELTCLAIEKAFYCNLSPFKCKPYNPLAICSGFCSLLKTSSILSYKMQPCAEPFQVSHWLTISLLRIDFEAFLRRAFASLQPFQKHHQILAVHIVFDEPVLNIIFYTIFPQSHWKQDVW